MKYQVLVENGTNMLYTATVVGLPDLCAQAATAQEAVAEVRRALAERLDSAEIFWVDIPRSKQKHPWMKHADALGNNPLFNDVMKNIAEYRRELDETIDMPQDDITLVDVETVSGEHPWSYLIGIHNDNPLFEDVQAEIEAYRRQLDNELKAE